MKNNICYAQHETPMVWHAETGDATGFLADHNLYWSETGAVTFRVASAFYDFIGWQGLGSSYDAHSPTPANPLWVSTSTGCSYNGSAECDFHLQSGSPAYNAGVPVGLSVDYASTSITTVPEIGAYEYIAGTNAITNFAIASSSYVGVIDQSAKTITIAVPYGTTLAGLMPTIIMTGASVAPASGAAQTFVDGVALNYTVTAENGATQAYAVTINVGAAPVVIPAPGTAPAVVQNIVIGGSMRIPVAHVSLATSTGGVALRTTPAVQSTYRFTRSLTFGMRAPEVLYLQRYLNTHGFPVAKSGPGALGKETMYFGPATREAVRQLQLANAQALFGNGIARLGLGNFGPLTRALVNQ
jgi:hypothetical protein